MLDFAKKTGAYFSYKNNFLINLVKIENILQVGEIRAGVLGGLDNWLFLFDGGQHQFDYLVGARLVPDVSVDNFFSNIECRQKFCVDRGIVYRHLVFPSKPLVSRDKLPIPLRDNVKSLFLHSYARSQMSGLPSSLSYALDVLLEKNEVQPVFYRHDTHLNDYGSSVVARWFLKEYFGFEYAIKDYFAEMTGLVLGDLARMLGSSDMMPTVHLRSCLPVVFHDNRNALPGNTNHIALIHNPHAVTDSRLLVFGDSFILTTLRYFCPYFSDIVYVRSSTFQGDLVELIGPNVVISSNTERYLCNVLSDSDSSPVMMGPYGVDGYIPTEQFRDALLAQISWVHHRNVYNKWRRIVRSSFVRFHGLGFCYPNDQVRILNDRDACFESLGNDPQLFFPRVQFAFENKYILKFRMRSEVYSVACLYYQSEIGASFSEEFSMRFPVVPGENFLDFKLDFSRMGYSLRFDPLICPGNIEIEDVVFIEDDA